MKTEKYFFYNLEQLKEKLRKKEARETTLVNQLAGVQLDMRLLREQIKSKEQPKSTH